MELLFCLLYDTGKHNRISYQMKQQIDSSIMIFKDEDAKKVFS